MFRINTFDCNRGAVINYFRRAEKNNLKRGKQIFQSTQLLKCLKLIAYANCVLPYILWKRETIIIKQIYLSMEYSLF